MTRGLLLGVLVGLAAWLPFPGHSVLLPGPALATLHQVAVENHPRLAGSGEYLIATVYRRPATLWWSLRSLIQSDWSLTSDLPEQPYSRDGHDIHSSLRQVVYQTCGLEMPLSIMVLEVETSQTWARAIRPGDRWISLQGRALGSMQQLQNLLAARTGREMLAQFQHSDGQIFSVVVPGQPEQVLGLRLMGRPRVQDLPKIHLQSGSYEGHSADLMLALDICERLLGVDFRQGRRISGSGGLAEDGRLTSVVGLRQKWFCARRAGARLFFVPQGDLSQLQGLKPTPQEPQIVPVHSLSQCLHRLRESL